MMKQNLLSVESFLHLWGIEDIEFDCGFSEKCGWGI